MNTFRHYLYYLHKGTVIQYDLIDKRVCLKIPLQKGDKKISAIYLDQFSYYLVTLQKNALKVYGETYPLKKAVLEGFEEGMTKK